jgi:putative heme transporter
VGGARREVAHALTTEPHAPESLSSDTAGDPAFVPTGMDRVAAWAWRLLVIGAALTVTGFIVWQLRGLFVPVFVALMLSTQLVPFSSWMQGHGVPSVVALLLSLLSLFVVLGLITAVIVGGLLSQIDEVGAKVSQGADKATTWVADHDGPLDLEKGQVGAGAGLRSAPTSGG